jgi:hypothetical protein
VTTAFCILAAPTLALASDRPALHEAQQLLYNARYVEAAAAASSLTEAPDAELLAADEIQSTALLFELRRQLDAHKHGSPAETLRRCSDCQSLLTHFSEVTTRGQRRARSLVEQSPDDTDGLFGLGKLDLNYLWLQLGALGKRTGWNEFWEARKSLHHLLELEPGHVRARVAVAWMEYIVDTRLPWGTEWLFGGGDRKKALTAVRGAAAADAAFFVRAEAEFALWEMLLRERHRAEAVTVAERLAVQFPENADVAKFLRENESRAAR